MSRIPLSSRVRHVFRNGCRTGTVWVFETARFQIRLEIEPDHGYRYDGDDEHGEIQAKLGAGEYVAFDSRLVVEIDGMEIAADCLGGSVYGADDVAGFWAAHRDADPMNRNCSHAGLAEVARRVAIGEVAEDAGIPLPVLIEAIGDHGDHDTDADDFLSDRYRGTADSWAGFAQELMEETYDMNELPQWVRGHIGWESICRDFKLSGDFSAFRDDSTGNLHFFWAH